MRSYLIEVRYVRIEDALELLLMKDQQMVQAFLPHSPQEALTVRGVVQWTKRVRSMFTVVPTNRLTQECIRFTNALFLQKDILIFKLYSKHVYTPSNCIFVAHPTATIEGALYPTYCGFI